MTLIARRLRSVLIALAVLALSATAVFAGRSALTAAPAPVASQPDAATGAEEAEAVGEDEGASEDAPRDEDQGAGEEEPAEAPDARADDGDASTAAHPDNHGKLVSEAAHAETPAGFDNQGAWIRSVAKDNHGHADAATRNAGKKNR